MYFKDVGYLEKEIKAPDELHRPKKTYTEQKVFFDKKSIGFTEFYQAQAVGLKPEIKVEVKCVVSDDITHFKFNDKMYRIIRMYPKEESTELVLTSNLNV